jgi:hypothetical protein
MTMTTTRAELDWPLALRLAADGRRYRLKIWAFTRRPGEWTWTWEVCDMAEGGKAAWSGIRESWAAAFRQGADAVRDLNSIRPRA